MRRRRNYSDADKRRLIEEATRENASVSGVARKYGISTDLMFRWRKKLAAAAGEHDFFAVTSEKVGDLTSCAVNGLARRPAGPVAT